MQDQIGSAQYLFSLSHRLSIRVYGVALVFHIVQDRDGHRVFQTLSARASLRAGAGRRRGSLALVMLSETFPDSKNRVDDDSINSLCHLELIVTGPSAKKESLLSTEMGIMGIP